MIEKMLSATMLQLSVFVLAGRAGRGPTARSPAGASAGGMTGSVLLLTIKPVTRALATANGSSATRREGSRGVKLSTWRIHVATGTWRAARTNAGTAGRLGSSAFSRTTTSDLQQLDTPLIEPSAPAAG